MKRLQLLILATLSTVHVRSQDLDDHQLPTYRDSPLVAPWGELVNRADSAGHPIGTQLQWELGQPANWDSSEYWFGNYLSGYPGGVWTHHLADGTYSKGNIICEEWYAFKGYPDGLMHEGCWRHHIKGGIWKYYDRDSNMVRTEKYAHLFKYRSCSIDTFFAMNKQGIFTMTYFHYRKDMRFTNRFFREIERTYDDAGTLVEKSHWNFWRISWRCYYTNGRLQQSSRNVKFFGFPINKRIIREYSEDGRRLSRQVEKAWERFTIAE